MEGVQHSASGELASPSSSGPKKMHDLGQVSPPGTSAHHLGRERLSL